MANVQNLASGTLVGSISASATSISVYVGEGSSFVIETVWPATPFYATIMPAVSNAGVANSLDSEIVEVTAVSNLNGNTVLTVNRGQKGTTAKAFDEGAVVTNGIYVDDVVMEDELAPGYITGEGTEITLPNTQGGRFSDAKLKGDTEQNLTNSLTLVDSNNTKGLTVTQDQAANTITYSGTTNASYPWINGATNVDAPMAAGTFVLSIDRTLSHSLSFRFYNSSDQFPTTASIPEGSTTATVTVDYAIKKVVVMVSVDSGVSIPSTTIKLTMSSTTPAPDYPQTVQTVTGEQTIVVNDGDQQSHIYKINLGKNLCTGVSQGYWLNAAADNAGVTSNDSGLIIPVAQNTDYTISTTATQARYRIAFSDQVWSGSQFTCYNGQSNDNTSITITKNSGTHKYLVVNATDLTKIQIEVGSTATTYAPYFAPVELCKIGNYQDYIYKSNGTWYLHKATDRIIDNGTKNYQARTNTSATHSKFYVSTDDLLNYPIAETTSLVSDHFIANIGANEATYSGSASCGSTASGYTKRLWYSVPNSIATTAAAFKTWVAANPVTTYYAMATPIDTPITGTLLDDLNAFDQATTYKGNTYITVSSVSPDLPATLNVAVEQNSALPVATETSLGAVSIGDGLNITEGGVLSVDNSKKMVFSTAEVKVGTWVDGKPLYRKVIQFTSPSNVYTYTQVATGITNADYAFIENGAVKNTNEGWTIQINSARGSNDNEMTNYAVAAWVRLQPNATNFAVSVANGLNDQPMWVSVLYTKTTD